MNLYSNRFNRSNCGYCGTENTDLYREILTQQSEKLNIWARILENSLMGVVFFK